MTGDFLAPPLDVVVQNAERAVSHFPVPAQFARNGKPRIHIGLNSLPNHEFLDGRNGQADEVDVFLFQSGAKQGSGYHREGNLHHERVDIDRADTDLSGEVPQRVGEGVLHDGGKNLELLSFKTRLDEAPLCAPGFSLSGEKPLAKEMAHPLFLDFGLVVVLRIRFQHMLNDDWIDGDNGLLDAPKIKPEGVAMELDVLGENPYRVVGHCARIQ